MTGLRFAKSTALLAHNFLSTLLFIYLSLNGRIIVQCVLFYVKLIFLTVLLLKGSIIKLQVRCVQKVSKLIDCIENFERGPLVFDTINIFVSH